MPHKEKWYKPTQEFNSVHGCDQYLSTEDEDECGATSAYVNQD